MKLNEASPAGEPLYECDVCKLSGEMNSYIVEEGGRDLCLPCWYEAIKKVPQRAESLGRS